MKILNASLIRLLNDLAKKLHDFVTVKNIAAVSKKYYHLDGQLTSNREFSHSLYTTQNLLRTPALGSVNHKLTIKRSYRFTCIKSSGLTILR